MRSVLLRYCRQCCGEWRNSKKEHSWYEGASPHISRELLLARLQKLFHRERLQFCPD